MLLRTIKLPEEALFALPQLRPNIRLSPFDSSRVEYNAAVLQRSSRAPVPWREVLGGGHRYFTMTRSGREALAIALTELRLSPLDEVLIITTSGSPYISRCVTDEVERVCRWTRVFGNACKAILVIHDFGFPASVPASLREKGLPIIEDCAYALGSGRCGTLGDYVVYSFPKAFPVQYGGLLCAHTRVRATTSLSRKGRAALVQWLNHYLPDRRSNALRRRRCFTTYSTILAKYDYEPLFPLVHGVVPHAFLVRFKNEKKAADVRAHMNAFGIESSVYYGGGGYYFPNHQNLGPAQIHYIVRHFLQAAEGVTSKAPREPELKRYRRAKALLELEDPHIDVPFDTRCTEV